MAAGGFTAVGLRPRRRGLAAGSATARRSQTLRWLIYLIAAMVAAAVLGVWLVVVILGCGVCELAIQLAAGRRDGASLPSVMLAPVVAAGAAGGGVLPSVAWVALKAGALSFGGASSSSR